MPTSGEFPGPAAGRGPHFRIRLHRRRLARETHYLDKDGNPQANADNVFGFTSQFDEGGLEVERRFFDERGTQSHARQRGDCRLSRDLRRRGNRVEAVALGADGQPTLHKQGFAVGPQIRSLRQRGGGGVPHGRRPACCRVGRIFDMAGRIRRSRRPRRRGIPRDRRQARASEKWFRPHLAVRRAGNQIEATCFGVDGKPTLHKDGFARWTARYNEGGEAIEKAYFGVDGHPTLLKEGFARWTARFDEHGNQVETEYFGIDGLPTTCKDGFAKWTARFDEGAITSRSVFWSRRAAGPEQGRRREVRLQVRRAGQPD